jgi:hypothetical protein
MAVQAPPARSSPCLLEPSPNPLARATKSNPALSVHCIPRPMQHLRMVFPTLLTTTATSTLSNQPGHLNTSRPGGIGERGEVVVSANGR